MPRSYMGPASTEFLDKIAVTGDKTLLERDPELFSDLMPFELRYVGSVAITAGNADFADEVAQHLFNKTLSTGYNSYALDYARAYTGLEAQLSVSS